MKRTTTDIIDEQQDLLFQVDEAGGEIDEELEVKLDELDIELTEKFQRILHVIESMRAQAGVHKARASQLAAIAAAVNKRADRLQQYLLESMQRADMDKCPTPDFPKLMVKENPESVYITDENSLRALHPNYYIEAPRKLDKPTLKADIRAGIRVEGAELVRGIKLHW